MKILIYVTGSGGVIHWDGPKLAAKTADTPLPPNPSGKDWLFFITTTSDDELIANQPLDVIKAFGTGDYFIFD